MFTRPHSIAPTKNTAAAAQAAADLIFLAFKHSRQAALHFAD